MHAYIYTCTHTHTHIHRPLAQCIVQWPSGSAWPLLEFLTLCPCLTEHRPTPPPCCPPSSVSHYLASSHTQLLPFPQVFFPDVLMLMQHLPCPLPTLWGTGQDPVAMRSGHDLFLAPQAPRSHRSSLLHPLGLEAP